MTPRFNASGQLIGYLLISRDVTREMTAAQAAPDAMVIVNDSDAEVRERRRAEIERDRFFTHSISLLGVAGGG